MADLQRIQNCMNQLSSLIQEVEAMPESADAETLKNKLLIWKSETDAVLSLEFPNYTDSILEQEIDDYTREVEDLNRRWRRPLAGSNLKGALLRKLRNARTDLRLIIQAQQPVHRATKPQLPEYAITDYAKALYNI